MHVSINEHLIFLSFLVKELRGSQGWWFIHVTPALGTQKAEERGVEVVILLGFFFLNLDLQKYICLTSTILGQAMLSALSPCSRLSDTNF